MSADSDFFCPLELIRMGVHRTYIPVKRIIETVIIIIFHYQQLRNAQYAICIRISTASSSASSSSSSIRFPSFERCSKYLRNIFRSRRSSFSSSGYFSLETIFLALAHSDSKCLGIGIPYCPLKETLP